MLFAFLAKLFWLQLCYWCPKSLKMIFQMASNIFAMCLSFENCEISWESVRFITWPPYWILKWLLMALVVLQEGRVCFGWVSRYCLMLPFKCCSSGRANQNLRIALINLKYMYITCKVILNDFNWFWNCNRVLRAN